MIDVKTPSLCKGRVCINIQRVIIYRFDVTRYSSSALTPVLLLLLVTGSFAQIAFTIFGGKSKQDLLSTRYVAACSGDSAIQGRQRFIDLSASSPLLQTQVVHHHDWYTLVVAFT